ncbi:MAG: hypothetical protein CM15mP79_0840 [Methanobacteriota archaeon]|nr:MAG: hypothetical protein CM15mP79_0840 [Euryarchaeota archaeon]
MGLHRSGQRRWKNPGQRRHRAALDGAIHRRVALWASSSKAPTFEGVQHRRIATLAPSAGLISLPEPQPDGSHLCFYDANGDGFADRDVNKDGLSREESVGCLRADITPLDPPLLRGTRILPAGRIRSRGRHPAL